MTNEPGQVPNQEPLAYFLTWTTYGTWLPGDERGWVAKPGEFRAPDAGIEDAARRLLTEAVLTLDVEQRRIVEDTIAEHCRIRGWHLHAVSARTTHVHVVVTAPHCDPKVVRDQFKAWCTRKLKERERARRPAGGAIREKWWTQGGSQRWINDDDSLVQAVWYVVEEQGEPTPRPAGTRESESQA
jgi:hypothetical protein